MTTILSESKVDVPEATAEMATESPENGIADIEEAGSQSTDRLLSEGRVVGILKILKNATLMIMPTYWNLQQHKATAKCLQFL